MKNWTDTTVYNQADKERKPRNWEFKASPLVSVIINRGHIHFPESWIMRCRELNIEQAVPFCKVAADDISGAQELALKLCTTKLQNIGAAFGLTVLGEGCM